MINKYLLYFKPTYFKVLVALLLFIAFAPIINYDNGIRCIKAPCENISEASYLFWLISGQPEIYSVNILIMIGGLILSYALTCVFWEIIKKK